MKTGVRLQDLAESLNLSVSTVSKSINNSPEISSKTKKRVKELAALKQYLPNSLAQNLKGRKTKTIGIIIPNVFSHFYAEALNAIEKKLFERGYQIILCFSNESLKKEIESIDKLIKAQVDGIIISPSIESLMTKNLDHIKRVSAYKISLVTFDRVLDTVSDKVALDQGLLVEEAILKLYDLGFRKICYLSNTNEKHIYKSRLGGYFDAIHTTGIPNLYIDANKTTVDKKIHNMMLSKKVDCFIIGDESFINVILSNASKLSFQIPEDFGLLSFSNENGTEYYNLTLSTIDQRGEDQGRISADLVLDRIEGILQEEPYEIK